MRDVVDIFWVSKLLSILDYLFQQPLFTLSLWSDPSINAYTRRLSANTPFNIAPVWLSLFNNNIQM